MMAAPSLEPTMQSLILAIQQLDNHIVATGVGGASRNVSTPPSSSTPAQASLPGFPGFDIQPTTATAARQELSDMTGGVVPTPTISPPSASVPPASIAALASNVTARQASATTNAPNQGETSTPPGVTQPPSTDDSNLLTMAVMDREGIGGPAAALRTRQYMFQQNIKWAASASNSFSNLAANQSGQYQGGFYNALSDATSMENPSNAVTKGLAWAQNPKNQNKAFYGYEGAKALVGGTQAGMASINDSIGGLREAGQQLGYGNQSSLGAFGIPMPWVQAGATAQGASLGVEEQSLMGRTGAGGLGPGLTGAQAQQAVGTLAAQGFSNQGGTNAAGLVSTGIDSAGAAVKAGLSKVPIIGGLLGDVGGGLLGALGDIVGAGASVSGNNNTIAQNLMKPLMNQGLSATDAAQWTSSLRMGQESITQLMDTLQTLPAAAKEANETIGQVSASLNELGQQWEQAGAKSGMGAEVGSQFQAATGTASQYAGALAQSPIYQALMIGQNGVLPSGIGDLPGGTQVGGMLQTVQLLQKTFAGLNKNKYENVKGVAPNTVLQASGQQLENSQIATMLGVPVSVIDSLTSNPKQSAAISAAQAGLGSATAQTGIFTPGLSQATQAATWQQSVGNGQDLGLSSKQMKGLDKISNYTKRATQMETDLTNNQNANPLGANAININVNDGKITIKGTTKGTNMQQVGAILLAQTQAAQNAGGTAANNIYNTPLGDQASASAAISWAKNTVG